MILLIGVALTQVGTSSAQARWDAAQQAYFLPVHNDSGVLVEVKLVPANLVRAEASVRVESLTAGMFRYHYDFRVENQSAQGLAYARVPCPPLGGPTELAYQRAPHLRMSSAFAGVREMFNGPRVCEFTTNLGIGANGTGHLDSPALPGVAEFMLVGSGGRGRWPTSDATGETASYGPFVDSILGRTANGLAVRVPGIAPIVAPPAPGDVAGSAAGLSDQITAICDRTDWVSPKGVCQSLTAKVRQVQSAITQRHWTAARGALGALTQELGAQDGRHVAPDAVALLSIWIGRVWSDIPRGVP